MWKNRSKRLTKFVRWPLWINYGVVLNVVNIKKVHIEEWKYRTDPFIVHTALLCYVFMERYDSVAYYMERK